MKLVCVMPVRNEAWVIGLTARAVLMWCDELVVIDHASTDATVAELMHVRNDVGPRIHKWTEPNGVWEEMRHRQRLLECARLRGATHIALIDADEILTGNLLPTIRDHIEATPSGAIFQLPWLQLREGICHVMTSGMWGSQNVSTAFKDQPEFHWTANDGYDHHHRHPRGKPFSPHYPFMPAWRGGGVMHLQFASKRRLLAKQSLYQCVERLRWPGRPMPDYVRTVRESEAAAVSPVPAEWWAGYEHLMQYLNVDAEPWQDRELRRLVAEHGREKFADLELVKEFLNA